MLTYGKGHSCFSSHLNNYIYPSSRSVFYPGSRMHWLNYGDLKQMSCESHLRIQVKREIRQRSHMPLFIWVTTDIHWSRDPFWLVLYLFTESICIAYRFTCTNSRISTPCRPSTGIREGLLRRPSSSVEIPGASVTKAIDSGNYRGYTHNPSLYAGKDL